MPELSERQAVADAVDVQRE
jgi:hypothetical protein